MVVSDHEPAACGERLELLAVVRGLEALDGPARVTLVTRSRYVSRGMKHGLAEWRANEWRWERFGRIVPVKDSDLWQRVDRALLFHQVECQAWQFEESAETAAVASAPEVASTPKLREANHAARGVRSQRVRLQRSTPAKHLQRQTRVATVRQETKKWGNSLPGLALLGRALHWKETLRGWGATARPALQGAA